MKASYYLLTFLLLSTLSFGQKVRSVEDFYESGKLYSTGYFIEIDSTSENSFGLWTFWYENGQKQLEELQTGILTKFINYWTHNGIQTLKNGIGKMYEADDSDSTIFLIKDSLKDGKFYKYRLGDKEWKLFAEGTYSKGLRHGSTYYYSNKGNIFEINNYLEGKQTGLQVEYYDNGNIAKIGRMVDYRKLGIWAFYDEKGTLLKEESYQLGKKIYVIEYHSNCQKKAEGSFTTIPIKETKKKPLQNKNSYPNIRRATKRSSYSTVKQGPWIYYSSHGQVVKRESYKQGILNKNGM